MLTVLIPCSRPMSTPSLCTGASQSRTCAGGTSTRSTRRTILRALWLTLLRGSLTPFEPPSTTTETRSACAFTCSTLCAATAVVNSLNFCCSRTIHARNGVPAANKIYYASVVRFTGCVLVVADANLPLHELFTLMCECLKTRTTPSTARSLDQYYQTRAC